MSITCTPDGFWAAAEAVDRARETADAAARYLADSVVDGASDDWCVRNYREAREALAARRAEYDIIAAPLTPEAAS